MAEFDVPNIGRARAALTALAKEPRPMRGMSAAKKQLVRALYTEIRAARLAGHSWREIFLAIRNSEVSPKMSVDYMRGTFRTIDKEFEKTTGVKALPEEPVRGKNAKKRAV